MNPESVFVSHFIGESNFLEGYVIENLNGNAIVELREGTKIETINGGGLEGKKVVLAIRPESVILEAGLEEGNNVVSGVVERITFEGPNLRYEIRLPNDDLVVVFKSSLSEEWLKIGDAVKIFLPVENVHVFPFPEAGLRAELSVA
jgi:ABC-type Fe3+/spermidine/putrescine transport system ATPase subunit